jgi:Spy/CpxP family protein refolding chaperone
MSDSTIPETKTRQIALAVQRALVDLALAHLEAREQQKAMNERIAEKLMSARQHLDALLRAGNVDPRQ